MHTCANCHSFSADGKTLGIDLDGPQNDKGLYALVDIKPQTTIANKDVVAWSSFRGKVEGDLRVGFMSRVSPDGQYVVTTIKPAGSDRQQLYYVANFLDYRFLQVFYPTRGILVWYDRATRQLHPLPGADDPRYVHTNANWSPDGKYLVFARAEARDAYPEGRKLAVYSNDPNETQIQYDLYRIPFNGGKGGRPEPIAGASHNGMSNSFPKVSPDGRWIVFVQCRNGQLMRPDSQLYIVAAEGGRARRMRANTALMNSWHSFSPNGRWLVFSSKSRSPYTQMFLTHLDEAGNDTPPILIEDSTAANRAVNIPEFVNIPPDGLLNIDTPATEFYRLSDLATELAGKGQFPAAIAEWTKAMEMDPEDARANNNFGSTLAKAGKLDEAILHYERALKTTPEYAEAHDNLGVALARKGRLDEAMAQYRSALALNPEVFEAHNHLGRALAEKGRLDEAIAHYEKALELNPGYADAHTNLGIALATKGKAAEAIAHYQKALEADPADAVAHNNLGIALAKAGKSDEAIAHYQEALKAEPEFAEAHTNLGIALLEKGRTDEAIRSFEAAMNLHPDSAEAQTNLGAALLWEGRVDEAVAHLERAVKADPGYLEAGDFLGNALAAQGRIAGAVARWRNVLRLEPNRLPVLNETAWVLATNPDASVRNASEAVEFAQRAVQLSGGREPRTLATLAAAYAESRRFSKAIDTVNRALDLATEQGNTQLSATLNAMLGLYQANTPLRAKPLPMPSPLRSRQEGSAAPTQPRQ
jgi:Flp pilus assembly protein TadD